MQIEKSIKRLVFTAVFLSVATVFAITFSTDDMQLVRQLADKFTASTDQQTTFLSKAKGLVATFSVATADQRDRVIGSIEDARYGGTMPTIQSDLDSLLSTAKATPAGVASPADGSSTTSAASAVTSTMSYLDRIASFSNVLDSYRFKQATEDDRTQVMTLIQSLFDDRADSFADERQRLSQVISNAKVLMFRDDQAKKDQLDSLITQLSTPVPFDVQLAYQKKLYSVFSPLTVDQKTRVLKHFQEMVLMVPALTDVTLNNDFRDLLQFVDVAFFKDDASGHSVLAGLLSKVKKLDPVFGQPFGSIIASLFSTAKATVENLVPLDFDPFITNVQTLVNMRYGNKPEDLVNKAANAKALQEFLDYLISGLPFSAYVSQLTIWLGMVKADNIELSTAKFMDRLNVYLSQDFMVQTNDSDKRKVFMGDLAALMNSRYGSLPEETTAEAIALAKRKLKQLLNWMLQIPWFSAEFDLIKDTYIKTIDADPATGVMPGVATTASSTVITGSGTFNVTFGSAIGTQLTQLEQSLSAVVNDNQKEMFMYSLFDVISRKSAALSADVTRMQNLLNMARNSENLGVAYSSYFTFLDGGLSGNFSDNLRLQVYQEVLARVAAMSVVAEPLQEKVLDIVQYLVENNTKMTSSQQQQVGSNISLIVTKNMFSSGRIKDLSDMYTELSMRMSGGTGSLTSGISGSTSSESSTNISGSTVTSSESSSGVSTGATTKGYASEQQKEQARILLNARAMSMR